MGLKIGLIAMVVVFVFGCRTTESIEPAVRVAADSVPQGAVVHYYVTADSAVMELWVCPDSELLVDCTVWREVSLDSLHSLGLGSPSENYAAAAADSGVVSQDPPALGNYKRSYIYTSNNPKSIVLGSVTWRSAWTPWYLRTRGTSCREGVEYFGRITPYEWGWRSYVQAPPKSYQNGFFWQQYGEHWFWHDNRPPVTSYAEIGF
jgi:hypothetical protein